MKRLLLAGLLTLIHSLASATEPEFLVRLDGASGGFAEVHYATYILPDGSVPDGARVPPEDLARLTKMLDRLIELGVLSRGWGTAPQGSGGCVDPSSEVRISYRKDGRLYSGNLYTRLLDRLRAKAPPSPAAAIHEAGMRGAAGLIHRLTQKDT